MKKQLMVILSLLILFVGCDDLTSKLEEAVLASHELQSYTLSLESSAGGSVSPAQIEVRQNVSTSISATPDGSSTFVNWTKIGGSGSFTIEDSTSADTTVKISEGDVTLKATFTSTPRNLTTIAGSGGSITTPSSSPVIVADGGSQNIVASPNTGYVFDGWSKTDGTGNATFADSSLASTSVTVTGGDVTIKADFTLRQYTMSVTVNDGTKGSVTTPATSSVLVTHGASNNIVASNPTARGYYFSGWQKIGGTGNVIFADSSSRSTTVTVTDGDVTLRANYSLIDVNLTPRGVYYLDNTSDSVSRRMSNPKDFVYAGGYVYVVGHHYSGGNYYPKVIKIDVSNPSNLTYSGTGDVGVGSTISSVIVANSTLLNLAVPNWGIRQMTLSGLVDGSYHYDTDMQFITNGWYSTDTGYINQYYNRGSASPDDNINDIMYISEKGVLYVTGEDDMGMDGSLSPVFGNGSGDSVWVESSRDFSGVLLGEMAYTNQGGDVYVYASAGDDGLYSFFVDDPTEILAPVTQGTSPNTGSFVEMATHGSYLITGGYKSGTYDSLSVYDIHSNNGSISNPYWLENFNTSSTVRDIVSMDMYGSYLYVLEGTYLRIYEFTYSVD